jgi:hypothetical protein
MTGRSPDVTAVKLSGLMRSSTLRSGRSRTLTILLVAVVLTPSVALVWLGMRLIEQDRALLGERETERCDAVTEAVARSLSAALENTAQLFADGAVPSPEPRGKSCLPSRRSLGAREGAFVLPRTQRRYGETAFARIESEGRERRGASCEERAERSELGGVQGSPPLKTGAKGEIRALTLLRAPAPQALKLVGRCEQT